MRRCANGVSSSARSWPRDCVTGNPDGVPGDSLDELWTSVDGVRHWLWWGHEHGFVLDILLQRHRDTEAAKAFMTGLLGEYAVPDTICTTVRSYGAAIRQIASLTAVDHQEVISTARCNNMIEQWAGLIRVPFCPRQSSIVPHGVKSDNSKLQSGGDARRNS